jgi:hypothetical protein
MPGADVPRELALEEAMTQSLPGRGDTIICGEAALSALRGVTLAGVIGSGRREAR